MLSWLALKEKLSWSGTPVVTARAKDCAVVSMPFCTAFAFTLTVVAMVPAATVVDAMPEASVTSLVLLIVIPPTELFSEKVTS